MQNLNSTIQVLMQVGNKISRGQTIDLEELEIIRFKGRINAETIGFWRSAVQEFTDEQVANIVKGLVFSEAHFKWMGGSVASTIWLFKVLVERKYNIGLLDELSSWILGNTRNPYNPFGTVVTLGARNYSQYRELSSARNGRIEIYTQAVIEQQAEAESARIIRKTMAAKAASDRGTVVRDEAINLLESMPIAEKLQVIATHKDYPPQFFPVTIASLATQEVIEQLPSSIKSELAHRLKGRRRGPWSKFKRRLHLALDQPWNEQPSV